VPRRYKQGTKSVARQFCTVSCEDKTQAREGEESPLLEAAAGERLVKTQQAGKDLAGTVIFLIVEISGGAVITCNSKSLCISGI
jgi:hypothetical protein